MRPLRKPLAPRGEPKSYQRKKELIKIPLFPCPIKNFTLSLEYLNMQHLAFTLSNIYTTYYIRAPTRKYVKCYKQGGGGKGLPKQHYSRPLQTKLGSNFIIPNLPLIQIESLSSPDSNRSKLR